MIQRVQSIYLFLTTLLSFLFFNGSILNFSNKLGSFIKVTFTDIEQTTGMQGSEMLNRILPLTLVVVLIPILSLATIFLYKKRNIQLFLSKILVGLVSVLFLVLGYYSYSVITKFNGTIIPGIKMALPIILLVLSILAYRGIKKDEELVKSYDRLR